jgi:hypothetical protein
MGEEVGAEYEPYKTASTIDWTDHHNLLPYYKHLISLRKAVPALRSRQWQRLEGSPAPHLYSFLRYTEPGADAAIVVVSVGPEPIDAEIRIPDEWRAWSEGRKFKDVLNDEVIGAARDGMLSVAMPALSARVLIKE